MKRISYIYISFFFFLAVKRKYITLNVTSEEDKKCIHLFISTQTYA